MYKREGYQIICDSVLTTDAIQDNSVDLIVTSPPYNVDIDYNSTDDLVLYDQFLSFTSDWMSRCYHWLKPDGRMCVNIPIETNKDGHRPTGADFTRTALDIGLQYKTTILWNKNTVLTRTAWGSWMSASSPNILCPVELILVFYKDQWKKLQPGISTIERQEFIDWTNGLWSFTPASKKRIGHPAPFPVELPQRCMKLFSYQGDTILDPFLGSGTTLIAAYKNKRRGIGIEIDASYYELAVKRFKNETAQILLF